MAYCSVNDVKRILRVLESSSNNQYKVRFSDSYTLPESFSSNSGSIKLKAVSSINIKYAGSETWIIEFTSSTAFNLYRGDNMAINDGSGNTGSNFTSDSDIITINSSEWVGSAQSGDKIKFRTDSNISESDANDFILDADTIIDGLLSRYIVSTDLPSSVPNLLSRASMYLAANLIFQSVFSNLNTEDTPTIVKRWYRFARDLVSMYLESISGKKIAKYARYARFVARESLFDKVGLKEVSGVEDLYGEREAVDLEYDEDYNTKESIGAT